ncbi:MAG: prephenate dehydrogenase/arogenate dehydrogenase family protein [Caldithrix sp.]|nr:prephenate dehydrogenase/arogenate dehydrogenase family protein [Caldithrix sp.]
MKILISGLGVMGASLAMAIKERWPRAVVYGYDKPEILKIATENQIIHHAVDKWPQQAADQDIIFLATPLDIIRQHIEDLHTIVDKNTVVSDIGSTKENILSMVNRLDFSGTFVGGHPMTGAEKSGILAANPLLYENAVYVIIGDDDAIPSPVRDKLLPLLDALKARILFLDAAQHDRILAAISHLPQLLAVSLVNVVGQRNEEGHPHFQLAAGGFRDLTRIASSPIHIWQDIINSNQQNVEQALQDIIQYLQTLKQNLNNLELYFNQAQEYRSYVPKRGKGFLSPLTDVMVYVNDEVGVVAKISNAMAAHNIDIRDIELLKIREKEGGVFRLSFANLEEAKEAVQIFKKINYKAFVRES